MNSKSLAAGQKKQDAQDKLERLLLRGRAAHPLHWPQYICRSIQRETAETTSIHSTRCVHTCNVYLYSGKNKQSSLWRVNSECSNNASSVGILINQSENVLSFCCCQWRYWSQHWFQFPHTVSGNLLPNENNHKSQISISFKKKSSNVSLLLNFIQNFSEFERK